MCGIAGWNVSRQWANEFITQERMAAALEKGWTYNLHRGVDAAGFMRHSVDGRFSSFKTPGDALTALETYDWKNPDFLTPSVTMGMHTRAATQGDAKDNINNHPVDWEGVYVTHNGTITNHLVIKKDELEYYPADQRKDLEPLVAEVDSIAIPMVLSNFDPWQLDELSVSLGDLLGGYAFHALWAEHPGTSLLVRGARSPLTVRYHPYGALFYASEDDANFQMIQAMGLDPNGKDWETYDLDEYVAMVVVDGVPQEYTHYKKYGWPSKKSAFVRRFTKIGKDLKLVLTSNTPHDWVQEDVRAFDDVEPKNIVPLFDKSKGGWIDTSYGNYPTLSATSFPAKVSEADYIYEDKLSKTRFVFIGNVEIVISEHGTLRDIYNHDSMKNEERWEVTIPVEEKLDYGSFTDFALKHSAKNAHRVTNDVRPRYLTLQRNSPLVQNRTGGEDTSKKRGNKRHLPVKPSQAFQTHEVGKIVDWDNFWELPVNKHDLGLPFLSDLKCGEHDVSVVEHENPLDCPTVRIATLACMSCVEDIEIFTAWWDGAYVRTETGHAPCPNNGCTYEIYHRKVVNVENVSLAIPMGMRCSNSCGNKKFIMNAPDWLAQGGQILEKVVSK